MNKFQNPSKLLKLLSLALIGFVWCSFIDKSFAEPTENDSLVNQGHSLFLHYCAHCHGITGDGDGYNAELLDKEPAELSDHSFIAKKNNQQIYRVIKLGGKEVKKSHLMPKFGFTLSEKEIWSLVAYVRHLASDKDHPVALPPNTSSLRPSTPPLPHESLADFSEWFLKHGKDADLVALGEKIFRKKKSCFGCHQLEEEGGIVGPDLSKAGFNYTPEWIFTWIGNPQKIKPGTKMPNMGLNNEECRAVTAYLASLEGEEIKKEWQEYLKSAGDPKRGEKLFFDLEGKATCAKCHRINDRGGKVGPALTFVGSSRTKEFLLESILKPKAVITAGYSSILILTKKGKFITGVKVNEDDSSIDLVSKDGEQLQINKSEIKKYKTQKISIMPGNFKDILNKSEIQDLLAYLTTLKISE